MKISIKRKGAFLALLSVMTLFVSCDKHFDMPAMGVKQGLVLCADGNTYPLEEVKTNGYTPIAVVYHVNNDPEIEGYGDAVYLYRMPSLEYADSLGITQGTSCDVTAQDGNANTEAMRSARDCRSPLAEAVFDMWHSRQSAYIPSVAQMRMLYNALPVVNPIIKACGGDELPNDGEDCWYWTSTEVKGMQADKAWLYSLRSGVMQETPKLQSHPFRPIVTINK
jgi:hypothetical protein